MKLTFPTQQQWRKEFGDLVRGASGGFLFGIPLLYTMEVWWIGSYTEPPLMMLVLAITFVIVFFLNRTDGFRQISPDSPLQAVMDSVEALAIGILCVTSILMLLQEITWQTPLNEALGKIVLEGMPFAIGVGLARSILSGSRDKSENVEDIEDIEDVEAAEPGDRESDRESKGESEHKSNREFSNSDRRNLSYNPSPYNQSPHNQQSSHNQLSLPDNYNATLADVGATLIGTIFVAFNIAPTDEVKMLAAASTPAQLLVMIAASLLISYCIVFAAGFTSQERRLQAQNAFQRPIVETVLAYLLSLFAATLMLWLLHRLSPSDPWTSWLEQILILGLPATIGGAAGRLAV